MLNIKSVEYGRGILDKQKWLFRGRGLIITSPSAYKALSTYLSGGLDHSVDVIMIASPDIDNMTNVAACAASDNFSYIIGVGGGVVMDAAKWAHILTGKELYLVPSVITTNAFATEAVGLRIDGKVKYEGNARMEKLLIDFDFIRKAPVQLNLSGIGDVLSIYTAVKDWQIANMVTDEHPYDPKAVVRAMGVLYQMNSNSEEIKKLSDVGIKVMVDCLMDTVEICQPLGHYRAEEGSEHFLFYLLEKITGRKFIHGQIIGLCARITAALQGQPLNVITGFIEDIGLDCSPKSLGLTENQIIAALAQAKEFVESEKHWYSVLNWGIDTNGLLRALRGLKF